MVRAVLDTNLLVSYALTRNRLLSRLVEHWENDAFVYLTSPSIIAELKDVLARPRLGQKLALDPQPLIEVIETDTEQTPGTLTLSGVCRDPKDDHFVACAVEGKADYIVTTDKDLLVLGDYQGIKIIRPDVFVAILDE